jgi:hypothetical protein
VNEPPERPGPVARLLGSLANALLDLGLPTIREWLRDRVGARADVGQITTDGSLLRLESVRIPIGPRGALVLDRASAVITALGRSGLPELRLDAFEGVLAFGDAAHGFRAEVSFTAAPDPEESAWVWGELAIRNASWTARAGSPKTSPMAGRARLFVSSREWRLDGGRLDGDLFRGRFVGNGVFEAEGAEAEVDAEAGSTEADAAAHPARTAGALLVPPALSNAVLSLERGRVGPFLDAISGLLGKAISVPSFIPLDAELDGDLSWSQSDGGRAALRVASEAIRASLHGGMSSAGRDLGVHVEASVRPALILRGTVPNAALPRDEDAIHMTLDVGGELRRPTVKGTLRAEEIGFRLGRPRFVPAVALLALESDVFVKDERAVVRAVTFAGAGKVTLDADANLRERSSVRGTLRADVLDAAFFREVVRTLGVNLTLPDDLSGGADFTLAPGESGLELTGAARLATGSSRLMLDVGAGGQKRITGELEPRDLSAAGLFPGAVVPVDGTVAVSLDVVSIDGDVGLRGTVGASELRLALPARPEVPPYVIEGATAVVAIGPRSLSYDDLRFRAHGGRFIAKGTIPFAPDPGVVLLDLALEEGSAELAEALAQLARGSRFRICVAREGPRPPEERWVPRDLVGRGRMTLRGDRSLRADVSLTTVAGTALVLGLSVAHGRLDGSTLDGDLAAVDAISSGYLGGDYAVIGIANVDVLVVRTTELGPVVLVSARSDALVLTRADISIVATNVSALMRIDSESVMWNRIEADVCEGAVRSSGVVAGTSRQSRVSFSQVAVHELPAVAGRAPASLVRGFLSGSVIGHLDGKLRVAGDVMLDEATFPALDLVRPTLARFGLRPPNEDASRPVTAVVSGTDSGIMLRDVTIDLRGATVRGALAVSLSRTLGGRAEVTLEEEYLRTSKLLTLPRVLTDRIVVPVRIGGSLDRPAVHASFGESLGRFLKENRVSAFVTSAVEEAQLLFGRRPPTEERHASERAPDEAELDAELRGALDAHHEDWELLRHRVARR